MPNDKNEELKALFKLKYKDFAANENKRLISEGLLKIFVGAVWYLFLAFIRR